MAGILLNRNRQVPAEETPAFGGIAERFRRGGDLDRAIALCRDGLKRFPDQLSARVTLGWALLDKGQYEPARAELEYVLRKAPDNLAAIRGLAELHDRTEGALPADDAAWKSEDISAAAIDESAAIESSVATPPAHEPLAPIPVRFDHHAAEVVHTAAQAEQDAAATLASTIGPDASMVAAPIELEDPAAASMAAADPAPFFVVDPGDATAFDVAPAADILIPVPFEVAAAEAVSVEIETAGAAALAAAEAEDVVSSAFAAGLDVAFQDDAGDAGIDWAGLTLTGNMDGAESGAEAGAWDEVSAPAAFDAVVEAPSEIAADAIGDVEAAIVDYGGELDLDMLSTPALDENGEDVAAVFAAPQGLDDIDEIAGQELADAIKALEEAAKRVEARLAPLPQRNEPAASPEDIAAFDFGAATFGASAPAEDRLASLDSSSEGAFELVSPDLSDLAFTTDVSTDQPEDDVEPIVADAIGTQFDFEAVPEIDDDVLAGASDAGDAIAPVVEEDVAAVADAVVADEIADDAPSEGESDAPAGVSQVSVDALLGQLDIVSYDQPATVDVPVVDIAPAEEVAVVDTPASDVEPDAPQVAGDDPVRVDVVRDFDNVIAWPDARAAAIDVDAAAGADVLEADGDVDRHDDTGATVQADDEPAAEAPLAALVAIDTDDVGTLPAAEPLTDESADIVSVDADTAIAVDAASSDLPLAESPAPVVHVYDVPVFAAAHAAAISELADLTGQVDVVSGVTMGQAGTVGNASPLAALERFLRKVQARQLELRGETMA